jgi:glycogen debranching enzyme
VTDADWGGAGDPPAAGLTTTIFRGSSFCLTDEVGDINPGRPQGFFHHDTRLLSRWQLRVDGQTPELLRHLAPAPSEDRFVLRVPPARGGADTPVLVDRRRVLTTKLTEHVVVRNLTTQRRTLTLTLVVDADFADVFAVKEGRVRPGWRTVEARGRSVVLRGRTDPEGVRVSLTGATSAYGPDGLQAALDLDPGESADLVVVVQPLRPEHDGDTQVAVRGALPASPRLHVASSADATTFARTRSDIESLRIADPRDASRVAVAAGAPWFMALFGRDSLLVGYMCLPLDQQLALGTLRMLAARQGRHTDPVTEEEPGRILHETRFGRDARLALGGKTIYYGSVDATPLFVLLLSELWRWGAHEDDVIDLLPAADRALAWCRRSADRDGDGFMEYQRATEHGLLNQGWKDSWNAIVSADGTPALPPIALCEVQGYHYAALLGRADVAEGFGDARTARRLRTQAEELRDRFDQAFWLDDVGYYAMALDGSKRKVDGLASNLGHLLWTGIVPAERAGHLAALLMSDEMFSGWGLRTLATSMRAYNPLSYHNGSVWPHDTAIAAHGLARYGFVDEAAVLGRGLLDAAAAMGGRLPELFAGFSREDYPEPVAYPTSCSPQAWASAAPLLVLRALLGLEVDVPAGTVTAAPALPGSMVPLAVDGVRLGQARVDVQVGADGVRFSGLPARMRVVER